MFFEGRFRHIGTVDPKPLADAIAALGEDVWFENISRQQMYDMHRNTQSLPLLYDEDGRHTDPTPWPRWAAFEPLLAPALDAIRKANPAVPGGKDGYFIRIMAARLNPNSAIVPHRDGGDTLMRTHRNHLPLMTNEQVEFEVAREVRYLAPGEIWEINNMRVHTVRNQSAQPRVHMIIDYVVPGEQVNDPSGVCYA